MAFRCLVLLALVCCYSCVSGEDPEVKYDAVSGVAPFLQMQYL